MKNDLMNLVDKHERVIYEGKPKFKCFLFESIFNPLLPFAIIWAIFDLSFIGLTFQTGESNQFMGFLIPFFLFHLMPVWLYLGGVLFTFRRYRNTNYIVTDKGIYVSGGILTKTFNHKPFAELSHVDLHRGIFDQMFGVGDIICTSSQYSPEGGSAAIRLIDVEEYTELYNKIKKLQQDIYTDVMYPNDLRPKENHGYNTEYKG